MEIFPTLLELVGSSIICSDNSVLGRSNNDNKRKRCLIGNYDPKIIAAVLCVLSKNFFGRDPVTST